MAGSIAIGVLAVGSARSQASAQIAQGKAQSDMFQVNAQFAELAGTEAIRRGDETAKGIKSQARQLIGSQRAAAAASGVEVDSGSALDIQTDTAYLAEIDAMTAKNNAWREAWGYKVDALNNKFSGQMSQASAQANAAGTLATGGLNAATTLYRGYSNNSSPAAAATKVSGTTVYSGGNNISAGNIA